MSFALAIAAIVIAIVAISSIPKPETKPPATLEEIQAPIAKEGVEIPVLFGTKDIKGANVVWYGDLKTKAIKSAGGKK